MKLCEVVKSIELKSIPGKITTLSEGNSSTYSFSQINLIWSPPNDIGCQAITKYSIKKFNSLSSSFDEIAQVDGNILTYTDVNIIFYFQNFFNKIV